MVSMAIPIFTSSETGGSGSRVSDRTEYYTTAKQLLSSGADAGERLMTAYKVRKYLPYISVYNTVILFLLGIDMASIFTTFVFDYMLAGGR